jgi:Zn-dependent protease with chaperone function
LTLPSEPEASGARTVRARYFDGVHSLVHPVSVTIDADRLVVTGDTVARSETIDAVFISERIGRTPRFLRFPDGAFCEVSELDALHALVAEHGLESSNVSRWEGSSRIALAAVALIAALAVGGYLYGVPLLARSTADSLPAGALDRLSQQTLAILDRTVLERTQITRPYQDQIREAFGRLRRPGGARMPIEFRKSSAIGANAFALPSGVIVVTDDLVVLASSPIEVAAVLAHEAGHVVRRHGLRKMIQSSVVSLFITWYIGDVSALAASAPTALLEARYSRDLEREADEYAARVLRDSGISPSVLADMLDRLSKEHRENAAVGGAFAYLSSHPPTDERMSMLRRVDGR